MNITVNGRNVDVTPTLRQYAEEKIGKFDRYLTSITEAVVTLSVQKHMHKAEVQIKANGHYIQAEAVTEELYASIDEVSAKLDRQVKKLKDKATNRRKGERSKAQENAAPAPVEEATSSDGLIIEREQQFVKPMPPEEAAMRLDADGRDFFMFTNSDSNQVNVIYKRNDGNLGLIEPAGK